MPVVADVYDSVGKGFLEHHGFKVVEPAVTSDGKLNGWMLIREPKPKPS
jgi:hypothetical protein